MLIFLKSFYSPKYFLILQNIFSHQDWNCDLAIGSKIRVLVHNVSVSGNCLSFCRLFILVLCDLVLEQQNDSLLPSPDCSLENSQLDLFDLISQFDILTILKRGNAKKLAQLEQRFNSKSGARNGANQANSSSEFGTYPGAQSFFQSFLLIGSCARLHTQLLDVLFESLRSLIEQLEQE